MPTRKLLPILLLALLLPATAGAAPLTPRAELALAVADSYWGGPAPLCTSLDAAIIPDGEMVLPDGERVAGWATIPEEPEPCQLRIGRSLAPPRMFGPLCGVMLHEDGHLHGLSHSLLPYDPMYPTLVKLPSPCRYFTSLANRIIAVRHNLHERIVPWRRAFLHRRLGFLTAAFWAPLTYAD